MDKRYNAMSLPDQLALRRQAIEDILLIPSGRCANQCVI